MLKILIVTLFSQILLIPGLVLAGGQDKVRESTILFKMDANATPADLKQFNALVNPGTILESGEIEGLSVRVVKIRNIKGFERAFSEQLVETGAVVFAEPDALIPHADVPNDPSFSSQWHHQTINSPAAWDHLTGPSDPAAVKVCVLDTGVDTDHPDLAGNLLLPGYSINTTTVEDANGHGTGTAGVIGAVGNNLTGVSGMVWNINIIPIRIVISETNSSAYISDMATGIRWCADQGGKVANLSYGGAQYSTIDTAARYLRDRGGLLFMSAGNDGTFNNTATYPDWSSFVIVGATSSSDSLASFSERGPFVDIVAPGQSILTTYKDARYVYYSGTSFSSPMAAGLGALIYSVNPGFTPDEVENYLFSTAVDLGQVGDDDNHGHGRIDAGAAVSSAMGFGSPNVPPTAIASADFLSGDAPLDVDFNGNDSLDADGSIVSYIWDFGDGSTQTGVGHPANPVNHTYSVDGLFTATLTVTDDRSASDISDDITIQVDPDPTILAPPESLNATVDANTVNLSWTHNGSGPLQGFEVHRAKKTRGKYNFALINSPSAEEYEDSQLALGDYQYKVRAISTDNNSLTDFSNTVSVTVESLSSTNPDPEPGTLPAPVLSASTSGSAVTLSWGPYDCPADVICRYYIERGDSKSKGQINFEPLANGGGLSFLTTEVNESPGAVYYRVQAKSGDIVSDYSNIVNLRLK